MSRLPFLVVAAVALAMPSAAQSNGTVMLPPPESNTPAAPATSAATDAGAEKSWSFSASAFGYIIPDGQSYGQPTVTADHRWLHLEARYNYEALETGSTWLGYNLGGGEEFTWALTPMVGGVFGELDGVAPGYELTLGWWRIEFYSEGEYVFDLNDSNSSYYYSWSELSVLPVEWFRIGMVVQRTRVYASDREVQRGALLGFQYRQASFTAYLFNPDDSRPITVLALSLDF